MILFIWWLLMKRIKGIRELFEDKNSCGECLNKICCTLSGITSNNNASLAPKPILYNIANPIDILEVYYIQLNYDIGTFFQTNCAFEQIYERCCNDAGAGKFFK